MNGHDREPEIQIRVTIYLTDQICYDENAVADEVRKVPADHSYSRTEHLVRSLLLGRFGWSNRVAMYSAHFDESGHPDDSQYLVVAGAVASVDQWVTFEREWLDALAPLGTRIFHAVDFDKGKPPFDHLTSRDAGILLDRLVDIACQKYREKHIACDQHGSVQVQQPQVCIC